MAKKIDGVIEAVRYKDGQIEVVRAYARRGAAFSDRLLFTRKELLDTLKKGRRFFTGTRKELMAGTFEVSQPLKIVTRDGKELITTRADADHDILEPAQVF
ncbi:MAG TPA: hypothetical protein VFR47_12540 [Anaerolineales bacterium]|nr:hypothetical protein [Anaerolineales bacterium]